jgi:NRPS condensation-like uncharacterized protein
MVEFQQTSAVTPIEHAFIACDRPQHPVCFFLVLRVDGDLDPERLAGAYQSALARHPMLQVILGGDPGLPTQQLHWVSSTAPASTGILWNPSALTPIDITKDGGVRLAVRQHDEDPDELVFQFHHGVTDARGGIQFIEDVLTFYAGRSEALIALDSGLLAFRGDPKHEGVNHKLNALRYIEQYAGLYMQKCATLAAPTHATGEWNPDQWPAYRQLTFDGAEYRRLKSRTIQKDCTVNDLLMRDLMLALAEWNGSYGHQQNVCLQMEINLRTVADARMPAAVHGSFMNISRSPHQMRDSRQLLDSIRQETSHIKSSRLGYAMLLITGAMARRKGGMQLLQRLQKPQHPAATACVGNLGELFRYAPLGKARDGFLQAQALKILDVSYLPSLKPGVKVSFGIATCMRRLSLSMHYDQTALSHEDARSVFETVTGRIRDTIGKGAVRGDDLKALIQRHRDISQRNPGFRSLPLGKHVATGVHIEMTEGKPGHGTVEQIQ